MPLRILILRVTISKNMPSSLPDNAKFLYKKLFKKGVGRGSFHLEERERKSFCIANVEL